MSDDSMQEKQTEKLIAQSAAPERDRQAQEGKRPEDPQHADDVMTKRQPGSEAADAAVLQDSRRHTRRAFALAAVGAAAGYGLWRSIESPSPSDDMQPIPIRRAFQANASLSRGIARDHALAPTYPLNRAENLRVNGIYGLKKALVPESYRLQLVGARDAHTGHPRFALTSRSGSISTWPRRPTKTRVTTPKSIPQRGSNPKARATPRSL